MTSFLQLKSLWSFGCQFTIGRDIPACATCAPALSMGCRTERSILDRTTDSDWHDEAAAASRMAHTVTFPFPTSGSLTGLSVKDEPASSSYQIGLLPPLLQSCVVVGRRKLCYCCQLLNRVFFARKQSLKVIKSNGVHPLTFGRFILDIVSSPTPYHSSSRLNPIDVIDLP